MITMSSLAADADTALATFEGELRTIADAALHQADPDGGWTVAQIVSHIHLSGLLAIADFARLQHHPEMFMFREELGHDALGAPPPSAKEAADRIASLRAALRECLPTFDDALLERIVDVPPFGKLSMAVLGPGLVGHLTNHAAQARGILVKRGTLS